MPERVSVTSDAEFAEMARKIIYNFLSYQPLYKKIEINDFIGLLDDRDLTLETHCLKDNKITGFKIIDKGYVPDSFKSHLQAAAKYLAIRSTGDYTFTKHIRAQCQTCLNFTASFLVIGYSVRENMDIKFFIEKVGQYPEFTINPSSVFKDFLTEDDLKFYRKGKALLNVNFGIGTLAYWRRIIENEIKSITNFIIRINQDARPLLEQSLLRFQQDRIMAKLIEDLKPFLPTGFMLDSGNPLQILWSSVSEGIHVLSENECTDRAKYVEEILEHVIDSLNQEKKRKKLNISANELAKQSGKK